ncbi:MAG: ABC transporter permease [Halanaerobiaceae bacterium]|nr:ABC transporter permease [Halanaerobiaceae bacterium]
MFFWKTAFLKDIFILLISSILLGTVLVLGGAYLADNYFADIVSGIIGDYGEYDLLFTVSSDQEELAVEQIRQVAAETLPGARLKKGPDVAGISSYLLKIPEEFKNEGVYVNLGRYFADIPGLSSRTIITEPRLSVRGFRGNSRYYMRPLLEEIEGINFLYPTGDGFDIIVKSPELLARVKDEIEKVLAEYRLLEIRYPLNQHPEDLLEKEEEIIKLLRGRLEEIISVTESDKTGQLSLLVSLQEMKNFLLSYASKVIIEEPAGSYNIPVGRRLTARTVDGLYLELRVIDNQESRITAIIQQGDIAGISSKELEVFIVDNRGRQGERLGTGFLRNPREDLALTLSRLDEIAPVLNAFITQSEQLIEYSDRLDDNLFNINQGLGQVEELGGNLSKSLAEWQEQELSNFLQDLLAILGDLKSNVGDISDIQRDLIQTSNRLKEGAGLIEERLIYVPRSNSIYGQLEELKEVFLQLSAALDNNYDLVVARLDDMDPVLVSIDSWQEKIGSLLKVEEALNSGTEWQEIDLLIGEIEEVINAFDTEHLQASLRSIQEILLELQTGQLPLVLEQLSYIQNSLPDMKEEEIVETINLIDSYIAGEVIPGDQIQLLLKGNYDADRLIEEIRGIIANPAVTYMDMEAGILQANPRSEILNLLRQVKAVISLIIAFVFTVLLLILDHSLIVSVLRLNNKRGILYGFFIGGFIFSMICFLSRVSFPYLNFGIEFLIGGITGLVMTLLAGMLNPVSREEWEAGKALGLSPAEIMHEIVIPAAKPGLLYLLNYPRMIFR